MLIDEKGEGIMQKVLIGLAGLVLATMFGGAANAQDTVKIGIINEYSGQFADTGMQIDNGIKLYVKQHGDTVAGKKIELIRKDTGGMAPDVSKRLAQELIVRDHADILAGFSLTPNALAAADISAEAKKFMVVMNAATAIITTKSPYIARTSSTTPQLNYTLGVWAAKNGIKTVYTMVSDYGPGIDAETWFQTGFKEGGGQVIGSVRFPVANPDFSAFVQAAKDAHPDAIYIWIPAARSRARSAKRSPSAESTPARRRCSGRTRSAPRLRSRAWATRRSASSPSPITTTAMTCRSIMSSSKPSTTNSIATRISSRWAAMTARA